MKKISLLLFLFITTIISAQFNVTDYDDVPILNGEVRTVSSIDPIEATLYFWIINESETEDILMKVELMSLTNTDGANYQFCFGTLCMDDVVEGATYPLSGIPENIPAGGTNPQFDKFQTLNLGDGENYPMDYVWRFFQVDGDDNEIGESITFTYRFDPNLSVSDFENNVGVTLQNTVISDFLYIESIYPVSFEIFSINGQLINEGHVDSGFNKINTSGFNSGLYLIRFSEGNNTSTLKFVVK